MVVNWRTTNKLGIFTKPFNGSVPGMSTQGIISAAIAAITGISSVVLQNADASTTNASTPYMIPVVSAIVSFAVSWGVQKGTIRAIQRTMERDFKQLRYDLNAASELIRTTSENVARIEGRLESYRELSR